MAQKIKVNIRDGWHRPQLDEFQPLALPFYPRSTGHFQLVSPYCEEVPAGVKNLVQLVWLVSGEMIFVYDGAERRLAAGDVCYRLPGESHVHRIISAEAEYYWIAVDGKGAADFINSYGFDRSGWHAGSCPAELFSEFVDCMREMTPFCWRRMCSIFTEILCRAGTPDDDIYDGVPLFQNAVSLCRKNFKSCVFNVNQLADKLGVNRSTINRKFSQNMGIPAGKYIEQLRIQYAISLLQSTNLSLQEIADSCGLYDASYLCLVIKKHSNSTPGQLRNRR
jgi:AraC-like DNA-binding protein